MRTPVTVELGGEVRELRYDLNAMVALKEKHGVNMLAADTTLDYSDPVLLRGFVWAGLLHQNRLLDPVTVGSWLDAGNLLAVSQCVVAAIASSMTPSVDAERAGIDPT